MPVRAHWIVSIRQQLIIVNLLVLAVLCMVGSLAQQSLDATRVHTEEALALSAAEAAFHVAGSRDDAIRADVLDLLDGTSTSGTVLDRHIHEMRAALEMSEAYWEEARTEDPFPPVEDLVNKYIADADHIVRLAATDPAAAAALYPAFAERYVAVDRRLDGAIASTFQLKIAEASERAINVGLWSATAIATGAAAASLVLTLLLWGVGRTLVNRLLRLSEVTNQMRAGKLASRTDDTREDELGALGRSFNAMSDSLANMVHRHQAVAARTAFSTQLASALDLADTHREATAALTRALHAIVPEYPAELLLADSSQANLERAATNPAAGAPGCPVGSPWSCIAVRHATQVTAADSEALDACPRLRGRPGGACSAVCVPVNFMGRALGVIHVTGPLGEPPGPDTIEQLTVLASQTGNRIGTIGVLEKTQLQSTTDGLTGLLNRRTVEDRAHHLVQTRQKYTVVMVDLDHFKKMNDTYGHDACDRALRQFAQVLRDCARQADIIGRFGGEEFILVLPGTSVEGAVVMVARIQTTLRDPKYLGQGPTVTASFGVVAGEIAETFDDVVRRADNALYRAKRNGRDQVAVGSPEDDGVVRVAEPPYGLTG